MKVLFKNKSHLILLKEVIAIVLSTNIILIECTRNSDII